MRLLCHHVEPVHGPTPFFQKRLAQRKVGRKLQVAWNPDPSARPATQDTLMSPIRQLGPSSRSQTALGVAQMCSALTRGLIMLPLMISLLAAWRGGLALAADDVATGPKTTIPEEKDRPRHDGFVALAKAGGIDLLFLGDSITDGWRGTGKAVWDKYFLPLKAENFGIGGDRTEHVIWRIRHGEFEGITPKLVVLMIGTNNSDSAADVALGIKTIIKDIQDRSPKSRILLLDIFPRGEKPEGREKNEAVNKIISTYADNEKVVYRDIGPSFLTKDGTLSTDIMPDLLHPNLKGYQIWADAIIDTVKQMMVQDLNHILPVFTTPSAVLRVAKLEKTISAGKVGLPSRVLARLSTDKNDKLAQAAKASMDIVVAWKDEMDANIARMKLEGDVVQAADLATTMSTYYAGDPTAKDYRDQVTKLKKDPTFPAGREFQKLVVITFADRHDPQFKKMVEVFVMRFPGGYYASQAQALIPHD
jgi:lysophospholipase L1-like esterase